MNPFAEDNEEEEEGSNTVGLGDLSAEPVSVARSSSHVGLNPFAPSSGAAKATLEPDSAKRKTNPFAAPGNEAAASRNPFFEDSMRPSPRTAVEAVASSTRNPFQEPSKNPFAPSLGDSQQHQQTVTSTTGFRIGASSPPPSSPPPSSPLLLKEQPMTLTQAFQFTTIEHRENGLRHLSVGDNLALVVTQSASTGETVISRREMTAFARSDGSISVRDAVETIHMDPSSTYALMSVRGSSGGGVAQQKDAIFFLSPQEASLKARGPLPALAGVSAIGWYEDHGEYRALVGSASGVVQTAKFSQNGLADLNPFFAMASSDGIIALAARPSCVLGVDVHGRFQFTGWNGDTIASGEIPSSIIIGEKQEVIHALADDEDDFWVLTRRGLYRLRLLERECQCELVFEQDSCFALSHTRLYVLVLSRHVPKQSNVLSTKLSAISKITLRTTLEKSKVSVHGSPPVQFARDEIKQTVWLMSERGLCGVEILDEAKGAWRLYLARAHDNGNENDFIRALELCETKHERDLVRAAQADWNLARKRYVRAAELYAETSTAVKSFEEMALSLSFSAASAASSAEELRERKKALRVFLLGKLNRVSEDKKTLRAMLCTWICEAFLDEMDHKIGQDTDEEEQQTVSAFCSFLGSYSQTLEPAREVIFHLILSHGRIDMLLVYAHLTRDYDRVVTHHMHRDAPNEAVRAMRDFGEQDPEAACVLFYKHSPSLIVQCPDILVEAWLSLTSLEPVKLVPALSRFGESDQVRACVLRYLEHCVNVIGVRDEAVHNLLLGAYASDEIKLFQFIKRETSQPGGFCFDAGFALRLCSQVSPRSRISLLDAMNMPEEACKVALKLGLWDIAQRIAQDQSTNRGDQELGKRLWLLCCMDVLTTAKGDATRRALEVVRASDGILAMEDLLQLLPDTVKMDELRDEVCVALEKYNAEIERLKSEMDEHTESAQALRRDAIEEKRRFDVIRASKSCDSCGKKIFTEQSNSSNMYSLASEVDEFYVFPCTHIFHSKCLCNQVISRLHGDRRDRVSRLAVSDSEEDQALLEEIVGAACPLCGEVMIQSVAQPLVFAKDETDAKSWE